MYARVASMYVRTGAFDLVLRTMRETVLVATQREQGFSGMLIMSDRRASKVLAITLWESEAAMLASEEGESLQEQVSRLITHLRGPIEFEHYEVEVL